MPAREGSIPSTPPRLSSGASWWRGDSVDQIALRLRDAFGFEEDAAREHLDAALRQWRELDLLKPANVVGAPRAMSRRAPGAGRVYQLLDLRFRLTASAGRHSDALPRLVAPLAVVGRSGGLAEIEIVDRRDGHDLRADGHVVGTCGRGEQNVPLVKSGLAQLALEHCRDFCALHAADIALEGGCLLLPGPSGSGKSTLAAALVVSGRPLFGDDTIVLAPETLHARPVPFPICLKAGAWDTLRPFLPKLGRLPTFQRLDGQIVRYLVPPGRGQWVEPGRREPVRWIVFPRRDQGANAELTPLGRLFTECCFLGDGLDAAKIDRLVAWIARVECFELRFASLEAAARRLLELAP